MMNATFELRRQIPISAGYDIVVAGGGPAGVAAAVCAGRFGAKVLLIEATGCLGGMGTSGLVTAFDPMADGEKMLVGGFMREVVETLYSRNQLKPGIDPDTWRKRHLHWTPFQLEGYKRLLDELVVAAGVEVLFFSRVIDAHTTDNNVHGIILNNIEGYKYVEGKTFIDATGDAVLAHLCGAACREAGHDTPRIMPATLCSLFAGINWDKYVKTNRNEKLEEAISDGHFTQPDRHLPGLSRVGNSTGYLNGGHIFNLNALRCSSLTEGMMLGRRIVVEYMEFYRKYIPGCENIELVTTAPLMGVRESRRIVGEYELNLDDFLHRRQFPDQIGVFNKYIDIHPYDTSIEEYQRLKNEIGNTGKLGHGECFGIPYGILVPKGWRNLWVAGRCASSDVAVHGVIRVMPAASMMGQAAGTAAVQSIRTGLPANEIDTSELVGTLRAANAYLPQETVCRFLTKTA